MIELNSLSLSFGGKTILRDINLDIKSGQWLCLVGPNGAGKSSLLKVLLGALDYSGSAKENGSQIFKNRNRSVAYVPQNPELPEGMRVFEYVSLGAGKLNKWGEVSADSVFAALEKTDIYGLHERLLTELSGGEFQRALLSRVLLQEADLILLDEPTSALDLHQQISVLGKIEELKLQGKTIISTMHDLTLAAMYADEIAILKEGTILKTGKAHEIVHTSELKDAFDNQINVYTLETGNTVIYPEKN